MRQVVLDTETTGLSPQHGHRLTEIGCLEIINRKITGRSFQSYLNPERELDDKAAEITGLSWSMLRDKPKFIEVADDLLAFIDGAELIIHNAPFDLAFLDHEMSMIKHSWGVFSEKLEVIDTLLLAREQHPGQRNSLDALCKRYEIDNSHRAKHGALLDAEILAHVYLAMTVGQVALDLRTQPDSDKNSSLAKTVLTSERNIAGNLRIIYPNEQEQAEHLAMLEIIQKQQK